MMNNVCRRALRKFTVVLDEVTTSSPKAIQPVRLLAEFISAPISRRFVNDLTMLNFIWYESFTTGTDLFRDAIVEKLDKLVASGFTSEDVTLIIVAGMIYHHAGNYEAALRALNQGDHLEWWGRIYLFGYL